PPHAVRALVYVSLLFCTLLLNVCCFFYMVPRQPQSTPLSLHDALPIYQQKESTARVASIMENTNLSKQQQVSEIMRQMLGKIGVDRKSGSAGMPRPISYAVFCLKKKNQIRTPTPTPNACQQRLLYVLVN